MGRKPNPNSKNIYWKPEMDDLIFRYNTTDFTESERNDFYHANFAKPFRTMVECIARNSSFSKVLKYHGDINMIALGLSHLATILSHYDKAKGSSFSFFSTCIKYFYIGQSQSIHSESKLTEALELKGESGTKNMEIENPHIPAKPSQVDIDYTLANLPEFYYMMLEWYEARPDLVNGWFRVSYRTMLRALREMGDVECNYINQKRSPMKGKKKVFNYMRTIHPKAFVLSEFAYVRSIMVNINKQLFREYEEFGTVTGLYVKPNPKITLKK